MAEWKDDGSSEDSGNEVFDDGYDSELFRDDDDRARLMALKEIEREEILAGRAEERQRLRERWEARRSKRGEKRRRRDDSSIPGVKRKRAEALEELASRKRSGRQVAKKEAGSSAKRARSGAWEEADNYEDGEIDWRDENLEVPRRATAIEEKDEAVKLEDLVDLQLTRGDISRIICLPIFESAVGLFVRVSRGKDAGTALGMCGEIRGVAEEKTTFVLEDGTKTNLQLRLDSGSGYEKSYPIRYVSNRPISHDEYLEWKKRATAVRGSVLTSSAAQKLISTARLLRGYAFTDEDVNTRLKHRADQGFVNIAKQRSDLKQKLLTLQEAKERNLSSYSAEEEASVREQLLKFEKQTPGISSSLLAFAAVNKRNRQTNMAALEAISAASTATASDKLDQFTRRKTLMTTFERVTKENYVPIEEKQKDRERKRKEDQERKEADARSISSAAALETAESEEAVASSEQTDDFFFRLHSEIAAERIEDSPEAVRQALQSMYPKERFAGPPTMRKPASPALATCTGAELSLNDWFTSRKGISREEMDA